ncbi:uncharacterized protein [Leptinotarsa decemlineata]|uniref:uncharacterized protein n=1 Tax=Leptinotarsa decemlineata TaxID=7539 RepID=UPI003D3044DB
MANVFVGFQNNQKNCRRSLKPPGGGTSDFFNFGTITDEHKKPEIITQVEQKKDGGYPVEQTIIFEKNELGEGKDNTSTGDQICETFNDMTVDQICEIEESEDELNKDSALTKITEKNEEVDKEAGVDKSTNATTTTKSSITMSSTTTRKELTSEKQSFNRVPPGGHSKGLW